MSEKLSNLTPGVVVELPEDIRGAFKGAKEAIYFGSDIDYNDMKSMYPQLEAVVGGVLRRSVTRSFAPDTNWNVLHEKTEEKLRDMAQAKYTKAPYIAPVAVSVGSDPEIFVADEKGDLIPAWTFLPEKGANHAIYWDGAQAEWRTPARHCLVEYTQQVQLKMIDLLKLARQHDPKATLSLNSVYNLPKAVLAKADMKYLEFGCAPSINVYEDVPERPGDPRKLLYRPVGGHVHFGLGGLKKVAKSMAPAVTRSLDGICGVACVGLAAGMDDPRRRIFYGRAGEIRLPSHGIEYRVLSNFWLIGPEVCHLVHELARIGLRFGWTGLYDVLWQGGQDEVRRVINECDVAGARKLLKKNWTLFESLLKLGNMGSQKSMIEATKRAINEGVLSIYKTPTDILGHWQIEQKVPAYHYGPGGNSWSNCAAQVVEGVGL